MRIFEILAERKSADLYHGTHNALEILQAGGILPQQNNPEYHDDPDRNGAPYISLTRDIRYPEVIGSTTVFVIDQNKLTSSHKMRPIDAQSYAKNKDDYGRRHESEERIYKAIPLSYIKQIIIIDKKWVNDIEGIEKLAGDHNIPVLYK